MTVHNTVVLLLTVFLCTIIHAQDSSQHIPSDYLNKVSSKAGSLEQKLDKKSQKALQQLQRQEEKIYHKLIKTDSLKAKAIFGDSKDKYTQLKDRLQNAASGKQYIASLDTLSTSLQFLKQHPEWLSKAKEGKLESAIQKVNGLSDRFSKAEEIKKFMKERKQYLRSQLEQLGFAKELKKLNKQVYYYSEQLQQYKELLKDQSKAEKKAIELLSKTKLFKDFMRKNSQLASLFRLPGEPDDPASVNLAGLQTRAQVNNLIQQQLAAGGPGAQQQFRQNIQDAQSQLNQLKDKMAKMGKGSSDIDPDSYREPDNFKPNNQKTKTFLQRLEFGTNFQSQKAKGFFPVTSDIGLSVGYKLNDKSIIGIGASYKMGWGRDIRHISITHQGVGVRSFADWNLKKSFWLTGGFEMNYRSVPIAIGISNIDIKNINAWQRSGLIGVSKLVSLKTKFFKKTRLQLLWDFLSYQQVPQTQPILFRIGYQF